MYQNIIVPIDHGNRNMKTPHFIYTSGIEESQIKPPLGEYLIFKDKYYTLTEKRIPYMRNKTVDDRFFVLTLFGIGMESEKQGIYCPGELLQVDLPVGLPPKHFGAMYKKLEAYFKREEVVEYFFRGRNYSVYLENVATFPQDYAAAITIYPKIMNYGKTIVIDIGGFTLDYLLLRGGIPDLAVCDSLENGVIKLYNHIISRINSEQDILLEEMDIDSILKGENTDYSERIIKTVRNMAAVFVNDLLGTLRERGIDLKSGCVVFVGGGALLLRKYLEASEKVGECFFIEDIKANAIGYGMLYDREKKAGSAHGKEE